MVRVATVTTLLAIAISSASAFSASRPAFSTRSVCVVSKGVFRQFFYLLSREANYFPVFKAANNASLSRSLASEFVAEYILFVFL
mmetsp:Transcript_13277/g.24077  ORF Transcript_13277/g.24077 Transcript_13277/m.24077 type:complete len:85 (-) Transcript_13277:550-804(-)